MIIRSAVFVVLLGLWAGMGWAGHITHDGCNTCEQIGPSTYNCTAMMCVDEAQTRDFERKMEAHKTEDCLAKMEAAMRAMEKYIPKFVDPVERRRMAKAGGWGTDDLVCHNCYFGGDEWVDMRSIEQKLAGDRARYEREQEDRGRQIVEDAKERWAYQEWDSVKRDCWKQP